MRVARRMARPRRANRRGGACSDSGGMISDVSGAARVRARLASAESRLVGAARAPGSATAKADCDSGQTSRRVERSPPVGVVWTGTAGRDGRASRLGTGTSASTGSSLAGSSASRVHRAVVGRIVDGGGRLFARHSLQLEIAAAELDRARGADGTRPAPPAAWTPSLAPRVSSQRFSTAAPLGWPSFTRMASRRSAICPRSASDATDRRAARGR